MGATQHSMAPVPTVYRERERERERRNTMRKDTMRGEEMLYRPALQLSDRQTLVYVTVNS